jgi:hypothetical protein
LKSQLQIDSRLRKFALRKFALHKFVDDKFVDDKFADDKSADDKSAERKSADDKSAARKSAERKSALRPLAPFVASHWACSSTMLFRVAGSILTGNSGCAMTFLPCVCPPLLLQLDIDFLPMHGDSFRCLDPEADDVTPHPHWGDYDLAIAGVDDDTLADAPVKS